MGRKRHYYLAPDHDDKARIDCSGYMLAQSRLVVGADEEQIVDLDSIVCQTYLSKLLGTLETWAERLVVARKCGYNMIHFPPIQALGGSQSCYCIKDQHLLEIMRKKWSILSITDILLNHTANESEWIFLHPESYRIFWHLSLDIIAENGQIKGYYVKSSVKFIIS
uniref:Glycogen debranching enzyme glucanotransferase domain-containing protein n=1 Tax=Tetranychus urticae TaxID=32264 RepID=T1K4W4_TETUR